jgi:hypothetical protein
VKNIFVAVNLVLVLIIIGLTTVVTRTWMDPKYPDNIDPGSIAHAPKTLETMDLNRKPKDARIINSAVQKNLFRQDRKEFSPPVKIVQEIKAPPLPALPPPDIKLKGVMLLGAKRIAFMEGYYPVREENKKIKKNPLKRKGYQLGAKIGNFELTKIEKTTVTLNNNSGVILNLNLTRSPEDRVIRKVGNTLIQKNKRFNPATFKKAVQPRASSKVSPKRPKSVRAPRSFRISGAPTKNPESTLRPHVSGR